MTPPPSATVDLPSTPGARGEVAQGRTLLLSPPSLSSQPDALNATRASYDPNNTDLQMLDRLSLGLVTLPNATYDAIVILSDLDGAKADHRPLLGREVFSRAFRALKPGASLVSQGWTWKTDIDNEERRESILAGFVVKDDGRLIKPDDNATRSVSLRLNRKPPQSLPSTTSTDPHEPRTNDQRKSEMMKPMLPAGVGFVDVSDDFGEPVVEDDDDDDLIDENTLLDEADMARPIVQPLECQPKAGKRRRACKDCTCGLKEKMEAEDSAKRTSADRTLKVLKLDVDDLAEVDFTVKGKVGSCGNCALGDAFRCDGCPYVGLPAFKPGEEVRLLNDDVQL